MSNYRHPGLRRVRNLGSELPAVAHFRFIRFIRFIVFIVLSVLGGSIFGDSFSKTVTFARKMTPTTGPGLAWLGLVCPKMVSGHNLHHMAPLSNPRPGFCMVFRCASFWFWVLGTHFWTPDPTIGPGISKFGSGWPGEVFGPKMGARKTRFCLGMGSKLGIVGFPVTQMDYGTQEVFGRGGFPPNPTRKLFLMDFPYFGEFGGRPLAPLCIPYWPFVG